MDRTEKGYIFTSADVDKTAEHITIPSEADGVPVVAIGDNTFVCCDKLKSVHIPESVAQISEHLFFQCPSLNKITVSKNNEHFTSENGVLFTKDRTTLICCPAAKSGDYSIPEGVRVIGGSAFRECRLLTAVNIPEGVTEIGEYAFLQCDNLMRAHIPNSVIRIGCGAFCGCRELRNAYIPDSVAEIGDSAFLCCESITHVQLPEGLSQIDNNTFRGCVSLSKINIPESINMIDNRAFFACESLVSIHIPANVSKISWKAFYGCNSLSDVYYSSTEEDWKKIDIGVGNNRLLHANIHFAE